MVGISLLDQHMAVKPSHFGDGEYTDATKAAGGHGQHLALSRKGKVALAVALKPVEGDVGGRNIALQSSPGEVRLAAVGSSNRCRISWYFTPQPPHILQLGVLPQWKPMKVSLMS